MKIVRTGILLLTAVSFCFAQAGGKQLMPEDPLAGANVFVQKSCSQCHSIKRNDMSSHLGPNLGNIHLKGSLLDIAGVMWNHAPAMMQRMTELKMEIPRFSGKEMANLVAFLTAYQYYLKEVGRPGDAVGGELVWKEKRCSACHSFQEDWSKMGPRLQVSRSASPIQMAQAMWNHGPEMVKAMVSHGVPFPKFSGNEMLDLISYIRSQKGTVEGTEVYVQPGNPNRGEALFQRKHCVSCHPVSGKGGIGAPDLGKQKELMQDVSHVAGIMWNHSVGMWTEMKKNNVPIPKFTNGEMADVIAYLYFINYYDPPGDPVRGKTLFQQRTCSACHRMRAGTGVGPNLAQVQNLDSSLEVVATMWNHAPQMSRMMRDMGVLWPRIYPGEMNHMIAYLLQERQRNQTEPDVPEEQ